MSKLLLSRLVISIFAIASSGTLLVHEVHQYVHQTPRVVGIPGFNPADLRRVIPNGEPLGFITDQTTPERIGIELHAANYSLAPFIVENTVSRRLLLGCFRDKSTSEIALRRYGLTVVRDFGNGFLLLARQ
jgi:hypothetical protein